MDLQAFYGELDDLVEVDRGTVSGETVLRNLESWNSMAVISFIALVDDRYGLTLPPKSIADCATAGDLAKLLERYQTAAR